MQIANCHLILNEFGSQVPKFNVTPAEVLYLIKQFQPLAGRLPIVDLKIVGEEVRAGGAERNRLNAFYIDHKDDPKAVTVSRMWPGVNPTLPQTFGELCDDEEGKPYFPDLVKKPTKLTAKPVAAVEED